MLVILISGDRCIETERLKGNLRFVTHLFLSLLCWVSNRQRQKRHFLQLSSSSLYEREAEGEKKSYKLRGYFPNKSISVRPSVCLCVPVSSKSRQISYLPYFLTSLTRIWRKFFSLSLTHTNSHTGWIHSHDTQIEAIPRGDSGAAKESGLNTGCIQSYVINTTGPAFPKKVSFSSTKINSYQ